jgi:dTDP-glucose 4,6-dehydratase
MGMGCRSETGLYVEDHCEAIWLGGKKHGRVGETYNIGGDNQPPNLQIVETTICEVLDELLPRFENISLTNR